MRCHSSPWLFVLVGFFAAYSKSEATQAAPAKILETSPIPYLSWQDIKALYPAQRHVGDWESPKLKGIPHKEELVARCERDLAFSLKSSPDPFQMRHALPSGKLILWSINKDIDSRIIYFVFNYDSELITDLWVIYYYDPIQDRFILKSTE